MFLRNAVTDTEFPRDEAAIPQNLVLGGGTRPKFSQLQLNSSEFHNAVGNLEENIHF